MYLRFIVLWAMWREKSLWEPLNESGLETTVYGVFGMNLTQMVSNENAWIQLNVVKTNVLSGGVFGIEEV